MDERDWLAQRYEENRAHLRAVAYRMLGSLTEADDAVQGAWLRLARADTSGVHNLRAWLTTLVARECLDLLRARTARREDTVGMDLPDPIVSHQDGVDPEQQALLAEGVGLALLVVLDTLAPAERLAFVLHDMFAVPFQEIAPIVGRSPNAAKMLASRARRRVQGAAPRAGQAHGAHAAGHGRLTRRGRAPAGPPAVLTARRAGRPAAVQTSGRNPMTPILEARDLTNDSAGRRLWPGWTLWSTPAGWLRCSVRTEPEDHLRPGGGHPAAPGRRNAARRRDRRAAPAGAGAAGDRARRPVRGGGRSHDRTREPGNGRPPLRARSPAGTDGRGERP
jgi:RNA polymerase sigma factor (sigma-70 family)